MIKKVVVNTLTIGALMILTWEYALSILDRITKTNKRWHRWELDISIIAYVICASTKQ